MKFYNHDFMLKKKKKEKNQALTVEHSNLNGRIVWKQHDCTISFMHKAWSRMSG